MKSKTERKIKIKHIAIEGMDGVGKSTTSKMLAERLGYKYIEKNLHELFDENDRLDNYIRIRDIVNRNEDRLFTSWFYGLGHIYLHAMYKNKSIVTDRYFLSNYAWSGTKDNYKIYDLLIELLGFPDLTVILYANERTISNRLKHRDEHDSDLHKISLSEEKYKKMIDFCEKYEKMPYMVIDTSELNPQEIVEIIMKKIKDYE